jgi:hypothetical protein
MIEQERALGRPSARTVRLEHDRREHLHPIPDELAVIRLTQLAGVRIKAKAVGAVAGDPPGRAYRWRRAPTAFSASAIPRATDW